MKNVISILLIILLTLTFAVPIDAITITTGKQGPSDKFSMIVSGHNFSAALKSDGTVWVWGSLTTDRTQFGYKLVPRKIDGLENIISIVAGPGYIVALKKDKTVWCWGTQGKQRIWSSNNVFYDKPVMIKGFSDTKLIEASSSNIAAVKNDGTVWMIGDNQYGQLGNGTKQSQYVPGKVGNLKNIKAVTIGDNYIIALSNDGKVWMWGANGSGNICGHAETEVLLPALIKGINGVKTVKAYDIYGILAIKNDGTVWTWGSNLFIFNEVAEYNASAVRIPSVSKVKEFFSNNITSYMEFIKNDGSVFGIEKTIEFTMDLINLGDTFTISYKKIAKWILLDEYRNIVSIAYGKGHIAAIKKDGTIWVKGGNNYGQLGNAKSIRSNKLIEVTFTGNSEVKADKEDGMNEIEVSNAQELIDAIGPDRRILLKPGEYNLSETSIYKDMICNNPYILKTSSGQMTVQNVRNLSIEGRGDKYVELKIDSNYLLVFDFLNVENVTLKNIRAGHISGKYECVNGVLNFKNSKNINISSTELYGCGSFGLTLENVQNANLDNLVITQCSWTAMNIDYSKNIQFYSCKIINHQCRDSLIIMLGSNDVVFDNCDISDNVAPGEGSMLFHTYSCTGIKLINSRVENNKGTFFMRNNKSITIDQTTIEDNDFTAGMYMNGNLE